MGKKKKKTHIKVLVKREKLKQSTEKSSFGVEGGTATRNG